jgi:hypothetical protein
MINRRYIIGIILALFMVCALVSVVDTVSAVKYKKIDSGKAYPEDGMAVKWTTYSNGNSVKTNYSMYAKFSSKGKYKYMGKMGIFLTKSSKTKLKYTVSLSSSYTESYKKSGYEKTSRTAKSYYFKYIKPSLKYGF